MSLPELDAVGICLFGICLIILAAFLIMWWPRRKKELPSQKVEPVPQDKVPSSYTQADFLRDVENPEVTVEELLELGKRRQKDPEPPTDISIEEVSPKVKDQAEKHNCPKDKRAEMRLKWFEDQAHDGTPTLPVVDPPKPGPPVLSIPAYAQPCHKCTGRMPNLDIYPQTGYSRAPAPAQKPGVCSVCNGIGYVFIQKG